MEKNIKSLVRAEFAAEEHKHILSHEYDETSVIL